MVAFWGGMLGDSWRKPEPPEIVVDTFNMLGDSWEESVKVSGCSGCSGGASGLVVYSRCWLRVSRRVACRVKKWFGRNSWYSLRSLASPKKGYLSARNIINSDKNYCTVVLY